MSTIFFWLMLLPLLTISTFAYAEPLCDKATLAKQPQQILLCYLKEPEGLQQPLTFHDKQYNNPYKVTVETYTLASQRWPKTTIHPQEELLWLHDLEIYRPDVVKTQQALLFVSGGTRYPLSSSVPGQFVNSLNFAHIAAETHSVVVHLKDIPNQFLTFEDQVPRKEDSIIAYSWNRYLDDPYNNSYWPAHLAMSKAVIKAMDAVQRLLAEKEQLKIKHFVVAGASKRGWATWLAALADTRINAIVPIVIDILNMRENLQLIYTSYNHQWPPAFQPYVDEKIPDRINTPEFASLIQIEDPLAYLACPHCDFYKQRLRIPKYIISASGDDFFVPDSLKLYLDKLPGENLVRVVPNQSHFIDMSIVEASLLAYYQTILNHSQRPRLRWKIASSGEIQQITTDRKPSVVKLWEAENPDRKDFRVAAGIHYSPTVLTGSCTLQTCHYSIPPQRPLKGWKASFVEVTFTSNDNQTFILTTPTVVLTRS